MYSVARNLLKRSSDFIQGHKMYEYSMDEKNKIYL